jgi:hypothetical protein
LIAPTPFAEIVADFSNETDGRATGTPISRFQSKAMSNFA